MPDWETTYNATLHGHLKDTPDILKLASTAMKKALPTYDSVKTMLFEDDMLRMDKKTFKKDAMENVLAEFYDCVDEQIVPRELAILLLLKAHAHLKAMEDGSANTTGGTSNNSQKRGRVRARLEQEKILSFTNTYV